MPTPDRYVLTYATTAGPPVTFTIESTPVGTFVNGSAGIEPDEIGPLLERLGHAQLLESKGLKL
jgi:hypothetical protein